MLEIVKIRVNGPDITVSIPLSIRKAFIGAGHAIVKCSENTVQDVNA